MNSKMSGGDYQVFLSFRGPDTRQGFTDCLYHCLVDAGVRVFRDNEEIPPGERIDIILGAIDSSIVCIPIFSKTFASSKWCLKEVAEMVKRKKTIMPIFYDVTPDDVKLKTSMYRDAITAHQEADGKMEWEEVLKEVLEVSGWKSRSEETEKGGSQLKDAGEKALKEVAQIKGWELKNTGFSEFCKSITKEVVINLRVKEKIVSENLVGMDDRVRDIVNLLQLGSKDVQYLVIHGMDGIGKTTLAKVVFNKVSPCFDVSHFVANVRESSKSGIMSLLAKIVSDLQPRSSTRVSDKDEGIKNLKNIYQKKKVLLVLDDVDEKEQIESLAGNADWFARGSRIMVTTRDKRVLTDQLDKLESNPKKAGEAVRTWEMTGLNPDYALQLFSNHAFKTDFPPADFLDLSRTVIMLTGLLPLALEITGSLLRGKSKAEWEEKIRALSKTPAKDVQKTLMIGLESLDYRTKQIFLDIACFFVGANVKFAVHMWKSCDFRPEVGLEELTSMSLVKIVDGTLWMHDHLAEIGREIVRMENFVDYGKRSRLWFPMEALGVIERGEGSGKIQVLNLDDLQIRTFRAEQFANLRNLRCIRIRGEIMPGDYTHLLSKLRWLEWTACPPTFGAIRLRLEKLVILDLSWSFIMDNWAGWSQMEIGMNLKVLNLSWCGYITKTPPLQRFPFLESLVLKSCVNLVLIDPDIGMLTRLKELDVSFCLKLPVLPGSFARLQSLIELNISCSGITALPQLGTFLGGLTRLRVIRMEACFAVELPRTINKLQNLEEIHASQTNLRLIPEAITKLPRLKALHLSRTWIPKLPSMNALSRLESLYLIGCGNLKELPPLPTSLTDLQVICPLQRLPDLSELSNLVKLCLGLRGSGVTFRYVMDLRGCSQLRELRLEGSTLEYPPLLPSSLQWLILGGMKEGTFPDLSHLENLQLLKLYGCHIERGIEVLRIGKLEKLRGFFLENCMFIEISCRDLPEINLEWLHVHMCPLVEALLDLSHLRNLKRLLVTYCPKLEQLQGLGGLKSLQWLYINWSMSLKALEDLSGLKMLENATIEDCPNFADPKDINLIVVGNGMRHQPEPEDYESVYSRGPLMMMMI